MPAILVGLGSPAAAHGDHGERVQIIAADEILRLSFMIDGARLQRFDRDGDGMVSVAEFNAQFDRINRWIDSRLNVRGGDGGMLPPVFSDLPVPGIARLRDGEAIVHARVIRSYELPSQSRPLTLALGEFIGEDGQRPYAMMTPAMTVAGAFTRYRSAALLGDPRCLPAIAGLFCPAMRQSA